MMLDEMKERYLTHLTVKHFANQTIYNHQINLEQFIKYLKTKEVVDVYELNRDLIDQYQLLLSQSSFSKLTIKSKLAVLCGFFHYLYEGQYLFFDLSLFINHPKVGTVLPRNVLTESEMLHFLKLPDIKTRKGLRDRAVLELLYSTGIRRMELAGLNLYDVNMEEKVIRVLGKFKKVRIVPFGEIAKQWLEKYLSDIRLRKNPREPAFFLEMIGYNRINTQTVSNLVGGYAKISKIKGKRICTHCFRHTCATHMLKYGADIRYVQELLGHNSPVSTQVYTRVEVGELERTYRKCHPRAVISKEQDSITAETKN